MNPGLPSSYSGHADRRSDDRHAPVEHMFYISTKIRREKKNKKLKNVSKFRLNIAKISIRFVEKFEVKDENFVIICVTSATDCNFRVGLSWLIPWLLGFPKVAPLGTGRLRPPRRTRILKMTKPVWISQVKMQYYKFECLEWRETSRKVV